MDAVLSDSTNATPVAKRKHTDGRREVRARLEASPAIRWIEQIDPVRVPDESPIGYHVAPMPNRHERRAAASRKRKTDRASMRMKARHRWTVSIEPSPVDANPVSIIDASEFGRRVKP